jgi:pimeloyl-ACP methyl ester carboxylesterase
VTTLEALALAGGDVEYRVIAGTRGRPLVFLHEGLGCQALWRTFPDDLAARTGRPAMVWSRHGYGRSRPRPGRWPVSYMHTEALDVLPELLDRLGLDSPILVGHSDGASIALIHAGSGRPVTGIVGLAPHVLVEERSLAGIRAARQQYATTDLPARLGRYHADPDATFFGWNDVWLDPAFRSWNIEDSVAGVTCRVLAVQCADDEYGTVEQVERIARQAAGRVESLVFPTGGHAPHQSHAEEVTAAVAEFVRRLP